MQAQQQQQEEADRAAIAASQAEAYRRAQAQLEATQIADEAAAAFQREEEQKAYFAQLRKEREDREAAERRALDPFGAHDPFGDHGEGSVQPLSRGGINGGGSTFTHAAPTTRSTLRPPIPGPIHILPLPDDDDDMSQFTGGP